MKDTSKFNKGNSFNVGVIGTGFMGQNHVRVLAELKSVNKIFVYDRDVLLAKSIAQQYGVVNCANLDEIAASVSVVIVATPTESHYEVALFFINLGIHCFVEKPLAFTEEHCTVIINAAKDKGVTLMVGHIERFNPATTVLSEILKRGKKIYSVEAYRLSYAKNKVGNVDVIYDLMIHDLDIVLSLIKEEITTIYALDSQAYESDPFGYVSCIMRSKSGTIIQMTASRITQQKIRKLRISSDIGCFELDYLNQEVFQFTKGLVSDSILNSVSGYKMDLAIEKFFIRNKEPLVLEMVHFFDCIKFSKIPAVSGEDGLKAVNLASRIKKVIIGA